MANAITEASIQAVNKLLDSSNFDLAAGLSETSLNDFLAAHWQSEQGSTSSVYKGAGQIQDVALGYTYEVTKPATVTLAPLKESAFQSIYKTWLTGVPELARYITVPSTDTGTSKPTGSIADDPPPNLQISIPALTITVTTSNPPNITVTLQVSMTVTGFLAVETAGGQVKITVVPIDARIKDQNGLRAQITAALGKNAHDHPHDDPNCIELQKLIIYIANVVLANRIGSFVREFTWPAPIQLFSGIEITTVTADIVEKLVVLMATFSQSSANAELDAWMDSIKDLSPSELKARAKASTEQISKKALERKADAAPIQSLSSVTDWPARGIFFMFHQRLFQLLANKFLIISQGDQKCTSWSIFKICYSWFLQISAPTVSVISNGLKVVAQFAGGASAKACISTHCGDLCKGVSATAHANPSLDTQFTFQGASGSELWMSATPNVFPISWDIGGLPWPFNQIVAWLLDLLSDIAVLFANLFHARWNQRLTTIPAEFPGTTLGFNAKFDKQILKDPNLPILVALGDIHFKPTAN